VLLILVLLGLSRVGGLGQLAASLQLLLFPGAGLLDLVQQPLLVGEQVGNAGVLLQLAPPFRVLLGQLPRLALLRGRRLFDLVPQPDGRPLGLGLWCLLASLELKARVDAELLTDFLACLLTRPLLGICNILSVPTTRRSC
jgi:hypothetical protein